MKGKVMAFPFVFSIEEPDYFTYRMLKKLRITLAILFFVALTLYLCVPSDFLWLRWMADIQFLPAVLALNLSAIIIIVALTLIMGRVYCSVICPLGVLQDLMALLGRKTKKNKKLPYTYSRPKNGLRYIVLILFLVLLISGLTSFAVILAPYSSYGRMVQNIIHPTLYAGIIALVSFIVIAVLAWRNGRTYCNTICPVGSILGIISRFSFLKPYIDKTKCNGCRSCARNCKAACINPNEHSIDYSRCVACMDCINHCRQGAIKYGRRPLQEKVTEMYDTPASRSKREFFSIIGLMTATYALAKKHKVDGGLAVISGKEVPTRKTPVLPPGALSARHFSQHCTACQLCVSACPNKVLRPSGNIMTLMQPEASFESGFCRPECTRCSDVCPTNAIRPITRDEKPDIQVGHAVVHPKHCEKVNGGDSCGNCARHCPSGAIKMVRNKKGHLIPVVDEARCTGCGACEYLCPVRPFSAIHVEGHEVHKRI